MCSLSLAYSLDEAALSNKQAEIGDVFLSVARRMVITFFADDVSRIHELFRVFPPTSPEARILQTNQMYAFYRHFVDGTDKAFHEVVCKASGVPVCGGSKRDIAASLFEKALERGSKISFDCVRFLLDEAKEEINSLL